MKVEDERAMLSIRLRSQSTVEVVRVVPVYNVLIGEELQQDFRNSRNTNFGFSCGEEWKGVVTTEIVSGKHDMKKQRVGSLKVPVHNTEVVFIGPYFRQLLTT